MTCYGEPGMPRATLSRHTERPTLEHLRHAIPDDIAQDLVLAAREHVKAIMLHVARGASWLGELRAAIEADDRSAAWNTARFDRSEDRSCIAIDDDVFRQAAAGPGISLGGDTRLAGHVLHTLGDSSDNTGGLDWYGILIDVIRRATLEQTREARRQIEVALEQGSDNHAGGKRNTYITYAKTITPLAQQIAEWLVAEPQVNFSGRLREILYRDGPIYVDMPAAIAEP
jgi:hypothetical protein